MKDEELKWKLLSTSHPVKNQWIDLREETYRMPDGETAGPFYTFSRRNYAVVAALDQDGRYICVRQFRQGIGEVTTEFPAGAIESGEDKPDEETALAAAKRELMEETGCVSDHWTHLITIPSMATISDNYAYLFLAENCRKAGEQDLDATEFLNAGRLSGEEIRGLIRQGKFQQAVHAAAFLMAEEILRDRKK